MAEDLAFGLTVMCASIIGALGAFAIGYWLRVLTQPTPPKTKPEMPGPIKADLQTINRWVAWNPWYMEDEAWRLEAQAIHLMRQRTHPGEPLEHNLAEVAAEMRRRHGEFGPTLN